ncbi:GNAT family N-acetyltransferase [Cochlodiniinecator piscidefendens]|uniref:GNAT family N-acetyltransferase n=1 Tax=Cochlodiniinecator piscidefendens TaxID=2715756 RepID=UPI001408E416|nr:N-acetyltransferase [Cochlodiniinecator piscidefendens]
MQFDIRAERDTDRKAIYAITEAAFGQPDEANLVDLLRADGDSAISLVAHRVGVIIGHIMFSPMSGEKPILGLAPVSVAPVMQGKGVGASLIKAGLDMARIKGYSGAFVLGNPDYYSRFGFSAALAKGFSCPYEGKNFMAIELKTGALERPFAVEYAPAFSKL